MNKCKVCKKAYFKKHNAEKYCKYCRQEIYLNQYVKWQMWHIEFWRDISYRWTQQDDEMIEISVRKYYKPSEKEFENRLHGASIGDTRSLFSDWERVAIKEIRNDPDQLSLKEELAIIKRIQSM